MTQLNVIEEKLKIRTTKTIQKLVDKVGISVNRIKTDDYTDDYDDVYGTQSGRSTDIIIKSTNESFTFVTSTDDKLTLAINGDPPQTITFGSGVQTLTQVLASINAVFSGLASNEGTGKIKLKATKSIDIKSTSTALTVLGLTAGLISNETIIDVIITGDEFTPFDQFSIGSLVEGFLYDPSETVEVGDIIDVIREGSRIRQFKVIENTALGSTTDVLRRFKISAILK